MQPSKSERKAIEDTITAQMVAALPSPSGDRLKVRYIWGRQGLAPSLIKVRIAPTEGRGGGGVDGAPSSP